MRQSANPRGHKEFIGIIKNGGKAGTLLFVAVFLLLLIPASAQTACRLDQGIGPDLVPQEFGKIIYQENPERGNRIFIIAQSHRSLASGANGADTEQVQAEIYRLGEWLIRNEHVEILLPEGYFRRTKPNGLEDAPEESRLDLPRKGLDDETLAARLADTTSFVNADYLLHCTYDIRLQQVEDKRLYFSVANLAQAEFSGVPRQEEGTLRSALDYQQRRRSAVILGNIPDVLDREYKNGFIKAKRAMVTIGLAHLREMIDFIKDGGARLMPQYGLSDSPPLSYDLSRLKKEYGITVILPRTLADNSDALRLTKLF